MMCGGPVGGVVGVGDVVGVCELSGVLEYNGYGDGVIGGGVLWVLCGCAGVGIVSLLDVWVCGYGGCFVVGEQ